MSEECKIRSVVLIGHRNVGKTMLAEAILWKTGTTKRCGATDEGSSVCDYTEDEIQRKMSISVATCFAKSGEYTINILDTPGYSDFVGERMIGVRAAEVGVIVVPASGTIDVGTDKAFKLLVDSGKGVIFFVNKIAKENADFAGTLDALKAKFGTSKVQAVTVPDKSGVDFSKVTNVLLDGPADLKEALIETVSEADDALMEKYLESGELTPDEIGRGFAAGIKNRTLFPVFAGDSIKDQLGVPELVKALVDFGPSPLDAVVTARDGDGNEVPVKVGAGEPFAGLVFKSTTDQYVGNISFVKVLSGTIRENSTVYNSSKAANEKVGSILKFQGREQSQVPSAGPGDIVALAKLKSTTINDTLVASSGQRIAFPPIAFKEPMISISVRPVTKKDEEKISDALHKLQESDPTLKARRDEQTGELVLYGMGDMHLQINIDRIKNKFGVTVETGLPKIPYKETIRGKADIEGKHKKQSGGHGQFAVVNIKFEPNERGGGIEFVDEIKGGSVPSQFIPAVEKGLFEAAKDGVLSGNPTIDFRARLHFGKFHTVDSSEQAFKTATRKAFKQGMNAADPVLLEPIMNLEVTVPSECFGDIIKDLSSRRGRVVDSSGEGDTQVLRAQVPLAEVLKYSSDLKSITGDRGDFDLEFSHYEDVPGMVQEKIVAAYKSQAATDEDDD